MRNNSDLGDTKSKSENATCSHLIIVTSPPGKEPKYEANMLDQVT